jgi:uncharacterized protein YecE (DUF72 family)
MEFHAKPLSKGNVFIGTSGWMYGDWQNFYPTGLKNQEYLAFYSKVFQTVEVNYSFYHFPRPATYKKWANQTQQDFVFALKLNRIITHIKRLSGAKTDFKRFLEDALSLAEKLGPILVQLPPSFRINPDRLESFLDITLNTGQELKVSKPLKIGFEFRHQSWFESDDVISILEKYNVALVFAHSSRYHYPEKEPVTADFIYLRFHGPQEMFASRYGEEELRPWAAKIKKWIHQGLDVYSYFNNDVHGYAVDDAKSLIRLVGA